MLEHIQEVNVGIDLMIYTTINTKRIINLKLKCKAIILIEEHTGENWYMNLGSGTEF